MITWLRGNTKKEVYYTQLLGSHSRTHGNAQVPNGRNTAMTDEVNLTAEGSDTTDSGTPTPAEAAGAATPSTPASSGLPTELRGRLLGLGLTDGQVTNLEHEGVTSADDMALLNADQIKTYTGCGLIIAMKVAKAFASAPSAAPSPSMNVASLDVLPAVPTDENWLSALRVGGVLKFNRETVIGTVSAALASKVGLYGLPKAIVDAMERQAQSLEEPVGPDFFSMQRSLTERSYAEIFAAIPGATGRYATDSRKNELLRKIDGNLWNALISFQGQLSAWVDAWTKGIANPALITAAFFSQASGGAGMLPPGMMAPPPTDQLRDAAEGVITSINRIFAGTGIPVAMALAYDAQQIRQALENPSLPAQVGAANREQMLRQLGVAVTSEYPRLEANLKRYALGVIELPNVTAGQTELAYVYALYQLGVMIPWDKLGSDTPLVSSPSSRRKSGGDGTFTEEREVAPAGAGFRTNGERERLRY